MMIEMRICPKPKDLQLFEISSGPQRPDVSGH